MATTTYCSTDDIALGDVSLPRFVDVQQYVDRAAEDIDAALGRLYRLPFMLNEDDPELRPTTLFLKKLNIYLATGRIILAAAGGGEDNTLHAWGLWHIKEAERCLSAIMDGQVRFPEQALYPTDSDDAEGGMAPIVRNKDDFSLVAGFYDAGRHGDKPWLKRVGP